MNRRSQQQLLSADEICCAFQGEWADRYPPILTLDEACALLRTKPSTLYEWKSKGRLAGCFRKRGKHLLFWRDKLIDTIFNGKEWT